MLVIHVDDILFAGLKPLGEFLVQALGDSLPSKILAEVIFFMGCARRRDRKAGAIDISQESYVRSALKKFNICRTSSTPASPAKDNRSVKEEEDAGDSPFREVVGCFTWVANQTRPDISNAVRAVAKHSFTSRRKVTGRRLRRYLTIFMKRRIICLCLKFSDRKQL